MGYVDNLVRIRDYIESIRTKPDYYFIRKEFFDLYDIIWDLLAEMLSVVGNLIDKKYPYPPDKLTGSGFQTNSEIIATGNGGNQYSGSFANNRIKPTSVVIKVTVNDVEYQLKDDGGGSLVGSAGSGAINYETGEFELTYNFDIPQDTSIYADYISFDVGTDYVILTWDKGFLADGYYLYKRKGEGSWTKIDIGDVNVYTDDDLDSDSLYDFKLTSYNYSANLVSCVHSFRLCNYLGISFPEDILQSYSNVVVFTASRYVKIKKAGFYLEVTGSGADNDLFLECDLKINDVSIFDTKPKIDQSADNRANTFVPATGVIVGELNENNLRLNPGDNLIMDLNLTRASSPAPDEEMKGFVLYLEMDIGDESESVESNIFSIRTK